MKPNHNDVKVFDNGLKMTRANPFEIEDYKREKGVMAGLMNQTLHRAMLVVYLAGYFIVMHAAPQWLWAKWALLFLAALFAFLLLARQVYEFFKKV
jgi:hypothetical protein